VTPRITALSVVVALVTACAGGARRAGGPPPEYERPQVSEWDAGTPIDPLEQAAAAGERVDDPPLEAPDGSTRDAREAAVGAGAPTDDETAAPDARAR
jgi:hypothetical protein